MLNALSNGSTFWDHPVHVPRIRKKRTVHLWHLDVHFSELKPQGTFLRHLV